MKTQSTILSRENTIWIQGISAIIIMVMHFVTQLEYYPRFVNILGSIGVAAFLVISGFGINESYKSCGITNYWKKRILRVIIPCWLVYLIHFLLTPSTNLMEIIKYFLFLDSKLWFVDYIIRCYIIFWAARRFATKYTTIILFIFSICCVFMQQLVCEQAFSFFFGYLVSENYNRIKECSKRSILKTAVISFLYGSMFCILKEHPDIQDMKGTLPFNLILLNIKLPFGIAFIACPYVLPIVKKMTFINWFGHISYEVYIVHYKFMPYITTAISIIPYTIFSVILSKMFAIANNKIRQKVLSKS